MSGEVKMKRRDRTVFRAAALAAFLLIMSTVILLSVRADLDYGRNRLSRVVEYVAKRCDAYSLSSTASETRSLMRVMEAAKQAARDIRFLAGPVDEDLLRGLSVDHYLSGILLLDRDGHITASYMAGADVTALLMPELEKDALLSAADFPQKVYAARIHCPDSSYIDMAAYGGWMPPGRWWCTTPRPQPMPKATDWHSPTCGRSICWSRTAPSWSRTIQR